VDNEVDVETVIEDDVELIDVEVLELTLVVVEDEVVVIVVDVDEDVEVDWVIVVLVLVAAAGLMLAAMQHQSVALPRSLSAPNVTAPAVALRSYHVEQVVTLPPVP
jgi:hypothetical protein